MQLSLDKDNLQERPQSYKRSGAKENPIMVIDTHSQLWTKEALESLPKEMAASYKEAFRDLSYSNIDDTIKDIDDAEVDKEVIVAIYAQTT